MLVPAKSTLGGSGSTTANALATTTTSVNVSNAAAPTALGQVPKVNNLSPLGIAWELVSASTSEYLSSETGATARTVQSALNEKVSLLDFAGADNTGVTSSTAAFTAAASVRSGSGYLEIHIPPGIWRLDTLPTIINEKYITWIIHNGCSFIGTYYDFAPHGRKIAYGGYQNSWVSNISIENAIFNYLPLYASITADARAIGICAIARTSTVRYAGVAGTIQIGFAAFTYNETTTAAVSTWAYYATALRVAGATGSTIGFELDIANKGSTVSLDPINWGTAGLTAGLWVGAGGEAATTSTLGISSVAMAVLSNDATGNARWEKGILFGSKSLAACDGTTGTAIAVAMVKGHKLAWYNTSSQITSELISENATRSTGQVIAFTTAGLAIRNVVDSTINFLVAPIASAANYITTTSATSGNSPTISAEGSGTNIDLKLIGKGTGLLSFGNYVAGVITQAGYITIKDSGGTERRLLIG